MHAESIINWVGHYGSWSLRLEDRLGDRLGDRITGQRVSKRVRLKPTHVIEEGRLYRALPKSIPLAIRKA